MVDRGRHGRLPRDELGGQFPGDQDRHRARPGRDPRLRGRFGLLHYTSKLLETPTFVFAESDSAMVSGEDLVRFQGAERGGHRAVGRLHEDSAGRLLVAGLPDLLDFCGHGERGIYR